MKSPLHYLLFSNSVRTEERFLINKQQPWHTQPHHDEITCGQGTEIIQSSQHSLRALVHQLVMCYTHKQPTERYLEFVCKGYIVIYCKHEKPTTLFAVSELSEN